MKSILQDEKILERFVEQMVLEKGIEVQAEEKEKIVQELNEKVEDAILLALPGEKLVVLNKMLDEEDVPDEKIDEIFSGHKKEIEMAVSTAMKKFKNDWMGR